MEKHSDERWADYTARRLETEGVDLTPYVAIDGFNNGIYDRIHRSGKWELTIGFSINHSFHISQLLQVGVKNQPRLPYSLGLEDILRETITLSYNNKEDPGDVEFVFERDNVVLSEAANIFGGPLGPLEKYGCSHAHDVKLLHDIPKDERTYPAGEFVEDLISFAQRLRGRPNLAYRKMKDNFEFDGGL